MTVAVAAVVGTATGTDGDLTRFTFSEPHMGTLMQITLFSESREEAEEAARVAFARIQELDAILSDYDPESELMRLTRHPAGTAVEVGDDLFALLERAQAIAEATNGAFDATLGPIARIWREARRSGKLPNDEAVRASRSRTGYRHVQLDPSRQTVTLSLPDMQLDLGGIAKGYAADQALQCLRDSGITRALVAAAGDLAIGDAPPGQEGWLIGIRSIDAGGRPNRTVRLKNAAISTSGDTEQFVEIDGIRYSHIVDPRTGRGLTERIGVTVLADDATTADSLSTAISVLGSENGLALAEALPDVEALIVEPSTSGRQMNASEGFPQK